MKVCENGVYRDMTPEEIAAVKAIQQEQECQYWQNVNYDEAVNEEIRKRYTVSQEFALLRQKEEKPEEYATYFSYCEECKAYVKEKKEEYHG